MTRPEHHKLAIVPGVAFGLSPYFRISYAASMEELKEAVSRIQVAFGVSTDPNRGLEEA